MTLDLLAEERCQLSFARSAFKMPEERTQQTVVFVPWPIRVVHDPNGIPVTD